MATEKQIKEIQAKAKELQDLCDKADLTPRFYLPFDEWNGYVFLTPSNVDSVPMWSTEKDGLEPDSFPVLLSGVKCHSGEHNTLIKRKKQRTKHTNN